MSGMIFRKATKDDTPRLAALVLQLNKSHDDDTIVTADDYLTQWAHMEAYVVEEGNVIIGYAAGYPTFHFDCALRGYDIQSVCIDETYRGKGFAQHLLKEFIKLKHGEGIKRFSLSYQTWNVNAQKCYAAIGFKERPQDGSYKALLMGDDLERVIQA